MATNMATTRVQGNFPDAGGTTALTADELELVGGGHSINYDVFHWLGELIGRAERAQNDLIDRNDGVLWGT